MIEMLTSIIRRLRRTASLRLDMPTSRPSRMSSGKPEAARTVRRKKIGSMPPKLCDPVPTPIDRALVDDGCPKCGTEMEPIEMGVEGPPIQKLQLCPCCYLVTWSDQNGL